VFKAENQIAVNISAAKPKSNHQNNAGGDVVSTAGHRMHLRRLDRVRLCFELQLMYSVTAERENKISKKELHIAALRVSRLFVELGVLAAGR
jgi:hypothetical protein